jgi:hypothetical protein
MRIIGPAHLPSTITWEDLLYGTVDYELSFVFERALFGQMNLRYPSYQSGGEIIFLVDLLRHSPACGFDVPFLYYRTDSPNRICGTEYRLSHALDLARMSDAIVDLFPDKLPAKARHEKARRISRAGLYLLLGGKPVDARRRLKIALQLGYFPAVALYILSYCSDNFLRQGFTRISTMRTGGFI